MAKNPQTIPAIVRLSEASAPALSEAATVKSRVLRLSRELGSLLSDKALPDGLRKKVESFRADLKKTWKELETESTQDNGHKGVASKESDMEEFWQDGEYHYVPGNITSFAQLDAAEAAHEIGEAMRTRVGQFVDMLNNIFFWLPDSEVPDKIGAAQTLFDEFVGVMGDVLMGQDDGDSSMAGADTTEAESFAESYAPSVSLIEVEGEVNPRSVLEMDVQLISPGWGNQRDNHYYPAEMLKRDARVFEGAKMYTTDHRQEEKSVRSEVSKVKKITGFTETGAPIARVIVFDPDFAEACRNRAKANELESLECSILADGRARPGFELNGRKGKVVEAITAVSSVDWVTRAGAGGKALNLAESVEGTGNQDEETAPVEESAAPEPVTIHEADQENQEIPSSTEETHASDPVEELPTQEADHPTPAMLSRDDVKATLAKTNLPASSVMDLAFGEYATADALQEAIGEEVKRLKEISGSGRPFGLGESSPAQSTPAVSKTKIEETISAVNKKFGFGR